MNIGIIIQARMTSERLPGKVLKTINGKPVLEIMLNRLDRIRKKFKVIVATSDTRDDDKIEKLCAKLTSECFRGPLHDVMQRYIMCAQSYNIEHIVRLTGDAPLIDPELVYDSINEYRNRKIDYLSTTYPPNLRQYPDGMDVEIFKLKDLKKFYKTGPNKEFKEHVTFQFWKNNYKCFNLKPSQNLSRYRLTLDYDEDFILIKKIFNDLNINCTLNEIIDYLKKNPKVFELNQKYEFGQGWNS